MRLKVVKRDPKIKNISLMEEMLAIGRKTILDVQKQAVRTELLKAKGEVSRLAVEERDPVASLLKRKRLGRINK